MLNRQKEVDILLKLMRAALHQDDSRPIEWAEGCDPVQLVRLVLRQNLVSMLYPVIEQQQGMPWETIRAQLKPSYQQEAYRGLVQEHEMQQLLEEMEQDGIDCLPMKGWILREMYPDPLMRSMSDLDILIRAFDSEKLNGWMQKHGYQLDEVEENFHDSYKKPPYLYVELHRTLIDERNLSPAETSWLREKAEHFWDEDARVDGKEHVYQLSDELFLIHQVSHFYKHFTNAGVGIRPLADIFLFLREKGETLDRQYIDAQLRVLHLKEFAGKMEGFANAFFEEQGPIDQQAELVLGYLTHSSIHGSRMTQDSLRMMDSDRKSYLYNSLVNTFRHCFLPLGVMARDYPVLKKRPWLLPAYWVYRGFRILFLERDKIRKVAQAQAKTQFDELQSVFRAAGIR